MAIRKTARHNIAQLLWLLLPIVLLVVFFMTHLTAGNPGLVGSRDYLRAIASHLPGVLVLFGLCLLAFRRNGRLASLVCFLLTGFFLFWGYMADVLNHVLKGWAVWGKWYQLALCIVALLLACYLFTKLKEASAKRVFFFINLLLSVYIAIDAAAILFKNEAYKWSPSFQQAQLPKGSPKPNIYLIVADEYSSTEGLRDNLHYDNTSMDSFLLSKGFSIQRHSRSNYNHTVFSMASLLNMQYISRPPHGGVQLLDYMRLMPAIENNAVGASYRQAGYQLLNISGFNIAGQPAAIPERYFPVRDRIFVANNWYHEFVLPLAKTYTGNSLSKAILKYDARQYWNNQETIWNETMDVLDKPATSPRFVYSHFMWTHEPYLQPEGAEKMVLDPEITNDTARSTLAGYLRTFEYANKRIQTLVDKILAVEAGNAIIILVGDHGRRELKFSTGNHSFFQNLNAVYFPDRNYSALYDSMSLVNMFRIVSNQTLSTNYELLPDSTILVEEWLHN